METLTTVSCTTICTITVPLSFSTNRMISLRSTAKALALAGPDAMLADESVLALHDLALVNPRTTKVMTMRRVRARMPSTVEVLRRTYLPAPVFFEGIATMPLADALLACRGRVQTERLLDATHEARVRGLLRPVDADAVAKQLAVV